MTIFLLGDLYTMPISPCLHIFSTQFFVCGEVLCNHIPQVSYW